MHNCCYLSQSSLSVACTLQIPLENFLHLTIASVTLDFAQCLVKTMHGINVRKPEIYSPDIIGE
jgi:hypothetical protein